MSEWIRLSDKLPDTEYVIGYALCEYGNNNWYVSMLRYSPSLKGCPFWDDSTNTHPISVSHWQPLPTPPESEE